jgi:hypothetical protein
MWIGAGSIASDRGRKARLRRAVTRADAWRIVGAGGPLLPDPACYVMATARIDAESDAGSAAPDIGARATPQPPPRRTQPQRPRIPDTSRAAAAASLMTGRPGPLDRVAACRRGARTQRPPEPPHRRHRSPDAAQHLINPHHGDEGEETTGLWEVGGFLLPDIGRTGAARRGGRGYPLPRTNPVAVTAAGERYPRAPGWHASSRLPGPHPDLRRAPSRPHPA